MGQFFILRSRKFVYWNSPVFLKRYFFICSTYTSNKCFFINHPEYVSCAWRKISHHAQKHACKLTIFLLLPRPFLLNPSPSLCGTLWTRSRLPCAYLSNMAESALAARAKIRSPCTLKHRVQQEYNTLLVNAWTVLILNNFKWLLTKLELSCVRNIIPRSRKHLRNGYPFLNQEPQTHDSVGRHIPV